MTSLLTTAVISFLVLVFDSNFDMSDLSNLFNAVIVYTLVAAAAPCLIGLVFGAIYGYLRFKRVAK